MAKKKQKTTKSKVEVNFKEGDLVGAKVKGHPLWPGRIETIDHINSKRRYTVRFFGTNDSSHSFAELLPYEECLPKFMSCGFRKVGLKEAFNLCQLEYNSQRTNLRRALIDVKVEKPPIDHSTVASPSPSSVSAVFEDDQKRDEQVEEEEPEQEREIKEEKEIEKAAASKVKIKVKVEKTKMKKMKKKIKKKIKKGKEAKALTDEKATEQSEDDDENKMDIDLPKTTTATTRLQLTISSPPSQSDDQERTLANNQLSLDSKNDTPIQLITEPKSEGENIMISEAVKQTTIAKLKEKVAKKMMEKEKRKSEMRERRLHDKISNKLKLFNKELQRFSTISSRISIAKSVGRDDINVWNEAVQIFHSVLPALARCINTVMDIGLKASNLKQCRDCHETLRRIRSNIRVSEKNNLVPMDIKKELCGCMKNIKSHAEIKKFIKKDFENLKNDMIERKENDA